MVILGNFSPKVPGGGGANEIPKLVNDEVSAIGPCKFEFCTLKTHIKTYIMAFSTKTSKSPKQGVVFNPKIPRGTRTGVLPGSEIMILCPYDLSSKFWKVSERSNERIKKYEAKNVIFGHFLGLFLPLLSHWDYNRSF